MNTTFVKPLHRSSSYTKFAMPLVLDPPRHCGLASIQLGLGKHLLGTSSDCTVRVRADDVATRHAMIVVSEHRTVVKALDPRTWVNEGPVSEMALRPGDRLSLGPLTFRVRAASPDELTDFATAYEGTFDDDDSHDVEGVIAPPVQSPSFAKFADEIRHPAVKTPVTTTAIPVVDSISAEARPPVVPNPIPLPEITTPSPAVAALEPSRISPLATSLGQVAPKSNAALSEPTRAAEAPAVWSASAESVSTRLDEIAQRLADLHKPIEAQSASADEAALRTETPAAERRQSTLRPDELQRRVDELTRQSQLLQERTASVADREAEVERSQARLAREHEQLRAAAEITRKELDDEYAHHMTLWQEWDAAYRRTSGELNGQLQSMEQRRTALMAEADRLAAERSELQRLQAEHERDRRSHDAERVQLTTTSTSLQSLRAEIDSERQQHLAAVQECEARIEIEQREISRMQEEMDGARQRLERDRSEFLAERSSEAVRREQEQREHTELRERLDRDHARIHAEHVDVLQLRRIVEADRAAFEREREAFVSQQAAITADRVELHQVRERLRLVESDLARVQKSHETAHALPASVQTGVSLAKPPELDWFVEPYKSLDLPPLIPAGWSNHKPLAPGPSPVTAETSKLKNTLPKSAVAPHTFETPQSPEVELSHPTEVGDRENKSVTHTRTLSPVAAPAAASHRFWEDNTLYDTSVTSHSPQPIPTKFVASSNLMMQTSGSAPAMATTLEGVASADAGARFASSATYDATPLEESVAMWGRTFERVAPDMAVEAEAAGSTVTMLVDDLPNVDETLAEINRQFGMQLPAEQNAPPENVASLPNWWIESDSTATTTGGEIGPADDVPTGVADRQVEDTDPSNDAQPAAGGDEPAVKPVDPLSISTLRMQLAQLFDLPSQKSGATELDEQPENAGDSAYDEPPLNHHEGLVRTLAPTSDDVSSELTPETELSAAPLSTPELTVAPDSMPTGPKADAELEAADDSEEDDSVASYMARLLSRTRGGAEVSAKEAATLAATADEALRQRDASNGESPVRETSFDPDDRSHLTAGPKHKQDRQAAREDLQSFRQVAHRSARSALARHTTKNLMSAVVAKSLLLGVSVLATTAFLGAPFVGMPTQTWKGLACSIATLLSAAETCRSWRQLRHWQSLGEPFQKNTRKPVETSPVVSASAVPTETIDAASAAADAESGTEPHENSRGHG